MKRLLDCDAKLKLGAFLPGCAILFFVLAFGAITSVFSAAETVFPEGGQQPLAKAPTIQSETRTKVADGEYALDEGANDGAVGPAGEEVYDFHESWTAWRDTNGEFEVEGQRTFESPRGFPHADKFAVQLSRDLTPIRITEFAKLRWRHDSGPIVCEFQLKEVQCSSGARDQKDATDLHVSMEFPYAFLWPISPFTLGGLVRQADRDLGRPSPIQLLSVEQPSSQEPILTIVRTGNLEYIGEESIEAAGRSWLAHKFTLKVPGYPVFTIWTSAKGVLLEVAINHADAGWPREQMKLVKLNEWDGFSGETSRGQKSNEVPQLGESADSPVHSTR